MTSMVKKLLEHFMKKNYKRLIKKIKIEKEIKRKGGKLYVKGKVMIIHLIAGSIKKT